MRKRSVVSAAIGVTALTLAGALVTPSTAKQLATNPTCFHRGGDPPFVLRAGVYTTRCFLPGMRVTVPAGGWFSTEDSPTQFKLQPPNASPNDATPAFGFSIDPHAAPACTTQFLPVDVSTPTKIIRWLKSNKNVIITGPRRTTIAGHIPALSVDLNVSAKAPKCDPHCPGPCIGYFIYRAPGIVPTDTYGTGRGEPVRFYFASIGQPTHLFVFDVDTPNKRVFARMNAVATNILASIRMPSRLPSRHGR